jgi:RimJ/RimL family protein N-acetyltransferase
MASFSSTRWGFVARDGPTPVGFADVEFDPAVHTAYFTYYVAPRWRGQGYSRALLGAISSYLREQTDADMLQGSVEPQNVASHRALTAAGFKPTIVDPDGLTAYELRLDR